MAEALGTCLVLFLIVVAVDRDPWGWACVAFPLAFVMAFSIWAGVRAWRLRSEAIVVEHSGRITYRDAELAPPSAIGQMLVETRWDSEGYSTEFLSAVQVDGSVTDLPGPHFTELDDAASASWLAIRLGRLRPRVLV